MSDLTESIKFNIIKEDSTTAQIEIETDSEKGLYFYVKDEDDNKRESIGGTTLESFLEVCHRAIAVWEVEAKKEYK